MKYCTKCGKELLDDAVVCLGCGCRTDNSDALETVISSTQTKKVSVSKVLGIIGVSCAWFVAIVGHAVSIVGIVLGVKEYKQTGKMTGLTLSIIGEACAIASSIIGALSMSGIYY